MLFSFDRLTTIKNLVIMAKWTHLFSSRTQKLSTSAATISRRALVKIAHRQVKELSNEFFFFFYFF